MPIFLSYSRQNEETVKALAIGFQAAEREVWYDHDLGGGDAWWDTILDNIRLANVFLFALSDASLQSKACLAELHYAKALSRPIVPVQVGEVRSVHGNPLAGLHTLPFRADNATSAFKIIAAIDQASRRVQALPDPLPPAPPIPHAYLLKLGEQIESTQDLNQADQNMVVDQLVRALGDENDPSIIAEIFSMLENTKSKPWCTRRTERRIRLILEEYAASSSLIEPPQPPPETETPQPLPETAETEAAETETAETETAETETAETETAEAESADAETTETAEDESGAAESREVEVDPVEVDAGPPPVPQNDPRAIFLERMKALGHWPEADSSRSPTRDSAPDETVPVEPLPSEPGTPEPPAAEAPIWKGVANPINPPTTPPAAPAPTAPTAPAPTAPSPTAPTAPSPTAPTARTAPAGSAPSPHWVRSILAIALMPVFGVVAFVFAVKVDRRSAEGDLGAAGRAAHASRTWAVVAIVVGGLSWLLYVIAQAV